MNQQSIMQTQGLSLQEVEDLLASGTAKEKIEYGICNSQMKPVLLFSDFDSMIGHVKRQQELHGKMPSGTPCKIITTIETEKVEWPQELS